MSETAVTIDRDAKNGRFLSGCKPGPGRGLGSRNRLSDSFVQDLASLWERRGIECLEAVARDDPATLLRVVASLMPKDINLSIGLSPADFVMTFRQARAALGNDEPQPLRRGSQTIIEHGDGG
jgi:hypothetical protein